VRLGTPLEKSVQHDIDVLFKRTADLEARILAFGGKVTQSWPPPKEGK